MRYLYLIFVFTFSNSGYLTYKLSGGRLGDNLLSYAHAKWMALQKGVILVYNPFPYSERLNLYILECKDRRLIPSSATIINRRIAKYIDFKSSRFYILPYYSEEPLEYAINKSFDFLSKFCNVNWDDPKFKDILKDALSPIDKTLLEFKLPEGFALVALHVRIGGGFDWAIDDASNFEHSRFNKATGQYLKIPPIHFYIDELNKLLNTLKNQKIYVHIFTDDPDPVALVEYIKSKTNFSENVVFDCRRSGNTHDSNVLEDFYALTKFKYLIRPQSNFSFMAARISDLDLEVYPTNYQLINGKPLITEVCYKYKK